MLNDTLKFNPMDYPYGSRHSVMYAKRGMVCTAQPLAAQAGLRILQAGGNAIDAAIATAICLTVVEPTSNGLGSDAFALVWVQDKLYGLNGSGYSPAAFTPENLEDRGITSTIPDRGFVPVMVPGAPSAWAELHKRFGRLPFAQLFGPAIEYAEAGYPVSPVVAGFWRKGLDLFSQFKDKPEFSGWFSTFAPEGKTPEAGQTVQLPDHAKTLKLLAASGCESFYRGEVAAAIDKFSKATGGLLTKEDLAEYKAQWVEPLHIDYRGYDVWEIPPNGQGIVALMALNILKGFEFKDKECVGTYHKQIEAMKLAFADGKAYVADSRHMRTKVADMLSEKYAVTRRSVIGEKAAEPTAGKPYSGGTVYLCTADGEGNMVSFIQSNYKGFGSGVVVPGYGISFNDRGCDFSLNPQSDNYAQPRKKPYHTIIPGFLTKDGKAVGPFGVMGAYMQPQGHVQVIMNTIDFLFNPQATLDAPRWQWIKDKTVYVEKSVSKEIVQGLRAKGHDIQIVDDVSGFGRGEIIWRDAAGVLCGATEPRADGTVAMW